MSVIYIPGEKLPLLFKIRHDLKGDFTQQPNDYLLRIDRHDETLGLALRRLNELQNGFNKYNAQASMIFSFGIALFIVCIGLMMCFNNDLNEILFKCKNYNFYLEEWTSLYASRMIEILRKKTPTLCDEVEMDIIDKIQTELFRVKKISASNYYKLVKPIKVKDFFTFLGSLLVFKKSSLTNA